MFDFEVRLVVNMKFFRKFLIIRKFWGRSEIEGLRDLMSLGMARSVSPYQSSSSLENSPLEDLLSRILPSNLPNLVTIEADLNFLLCSSLRELSANNNLPTQIPTSHKKTYQHKYF